MLEIVFLTLKLAFVSTVILLIFGTPLAYWLARSPVWWREIIGAIVTLPLVLPATVIGFYLLVFLAPNSPAGEVLGNLFGHPLPFHFEGLVLGSVIYSLPFVVQPIRIAFEAMGELPLEAAATLRSSPLNAFFTVALPLARSGLITGGVLGFAHTIGEFGVVLMIGGSIPGETRVLSIAIYEAVENLEWSKAHIMAGGMLGFSFAVILLMMLLNKTMDRSRNA
ncbi:MAG: molybdate ABC transporter permease subunit [Cohaesibacteraceae bacterium]|nr:molybdate ABC transporter permease subunit [Cohaesibacteraceae bacterium]